MIKTFSPLLMLGLIFVLAACQPSPPAAPPTGILPSATLPPITATAFQPQAATATLQVYPTFTATIAPPTSTPHALEKYTITAMRNRSYGFGAIQMLGQISDEGSFTREKFRYPSDGITVYGYVNIPKGEGPFPVVIVLHGNYDPQNYELMPYTTYFADRMAKKGYAVFHPNMRNYGESGQGDDRYRTGQASDVLNLLGMIELQGRQPGPLSMLDPSRVGLWAFSMGGEVALRVLTISNKFDATVLYSPMSGDLLKAAKFIPSEVELNTPPELISTISISDSFVLITTPIQLHHGSADAVIPVVWSEETCAALTALGKNIDCTFYAGEGHSFSGNTIPRFEESFYSFFEAYLQ